MHSNAPSEVREYTILLATSIIVDKLSKSQDEVVQLFNRIDEN